MGHKLGSGEVAGRSSAQRPRGLYREHGEVPREAVRRSLPEGRAWRGSLSNVEAQDLRH